MPTKPLVLTLACSAAIFAQSPQLVGTNPDSAVTGTNSAPILLYGHNFKPGAAIFWNSVSLGTGQFNGPESLVTIIPPLLLAAAGTAQITVHNPDGSVSNASPFTVQNTPATPNFVGALPGTGQTFDDRKLFFVGSGIQPGVVLRWNGQVFQAEAGYPFLRFPIPKTLMLTPGPVTLNLTNPNGSPSNALELDVPTPRIMTSISPSSIPVGSGSFTLTINGSGFGPQDVVILLPPTGAALFLTPQFISTTQLQMAMPAFRVRTHGTYIVAVAYYGPPAGAGLPFFPIGEPSNFDYFSANTLPLTVGPPGCSYSLSASSSTVGTAASIGSVQVITQPGCTWTATSPSGAVTITAGASGTGSGAVNYSVTASNSAQSTTLTIAGLPFTINQVPSCLFGLTPAGATVAAAGASGNFALGVTNASCAWTASSNVPWLTILSGASRTGNGTINYSAAPNASATGRSGAITAGGQSFTVVQAGNAPLATYGTGRCSSESRYSGSCSRGG
jgi:hypothetical protein